MSRMGFQARPKVFFFDGRRAESTQYAVPSTQYSVTEFLLTIQTHSRSSPPTPGSSNMQLRRLLFLALLVSVGVSPCAAGDLIDPAKAGSEEGSDTLWYDLRLLDVEGRGWTNTKAFYDRL